MNSEIERYGQRRLCLECVTQYHRGLSVECVRKIRAIRFIWKYGRLDGISITMRLIRSLMECFDNTCAVTGVTARPGSRRLSEKLTICPMRLGETVSKSSDLIVISSAVLARITRQKGLPKEDASTCVMAAMERPEVQERVRRAHLRLAAFEASNPPEMSGEEKMTRLQGLIDKASVRKRSMDSKQV